MEATGNAIPIAVGIAISPLAVAALMVMLLTPRARVNAPAFVLGWLFGFFIVGSLAHFIPGVETSSDKPGPLAGIVRLVLGLVLLLLAFRQFRRQAGSGEARTQRFLARIDNMNMGHCVLAGLLLTAGHPKNLPLIAAGVAAIGRYDLDISSEIVAFLIFTMVSSVTLVLPIMLFFLARHRVEIIFGHWKSWLIRNNDIIVLLLLLVFGALLIGRGLKMLAA